MDEGLSFHENLSGVLSRNFETSGPLLFAWVLPALVLVLVLGFAYLRFVLSLSRRIAVLVALSAVMFVAGAIGMEMIAGMIVSASAIHADAYVSQEYTLFAHIEEGLEATAIIIFIYALLLQCSRVFPHVVAQVPSLEGNAELRPEQQE